MDPEIGLHRQRSNTAQKLEKMDLARRKAAKIKNFKCDDSVANINQEFNLNNLFVKKKEYERRDRLKKNVNSLLAEQLQQCPKQPQNKFLEYARFDGTAQTGIPTRTLKIFLTMLPVHISNYPIQLCVTATAKIQEFIGLICYKCSISYPDMPLLSVKDYGLFITEEDGEVDYDFPALDLREPCSKFCFSHLALVEHKLTDLPIRSDERNVSLISESEKLAKLADSKARENQQTEDLARMKGHTTLMEAPLYQTYRLYILNKSLFKTEIQLGISGEKIEIDPVQQKNSKFWTRQKAVSHSMESVAWCEIIEIKSTRATFRIVYSLTHHNQQQTTTNENYNTSTSSPLQNSASFKNYDFETNPNTAQEIVDKINNILGVRSSTSRREYLASKEKRKLLQNKYKKNQIK